GIAVPRQFGEFFGVGLDQVDALAGGHEGEHGGPRGIDGDLRAAARLAHGPHGTHVEVARQPGGKGTGQHQPGGVSRVGNEEVDEGGALVPREGGPGLVDLRRGAVGLREGQVGTHGPRDGKARRGDAGRGERQQHGVILAAGKHGHRLDAGGDEGPRDIDALAAGLLAPCAGALHLAPGEGCRELDGAIEARIRGEGDDHAMTTSTPAASKDSPRAASGAASVTSMSMSERAAKRSSDSTPSFDSSARATARWAPLVSAVLTAASSVSGVLSPNLSWMPLAPMKEMSGRSAESWVSVVAPTAAPVMPRMRPPSVWISMWGL